MNWFVYFISPYLHLYSEIRLHAYNVLTPNQIILLISNRYVKLWNYFSTEDILGSLTTFSQFRDTRFKTIFFSAEIFLKGDIIYSHISYFMSVWVIGGDWLRGGGRVQLHWAFIYICSFPLIFYMLLLLWLLGTLSRPKIGQMVAS